jgi:hypothetical protein
MAGMDEATRKRVRAGRLMLAGKTPAESGVSGFLCVRRLGDLSTAAVGACDERPTRWASRGRILTRPVS